MHIFLLLSFLSLAPSSWAADCLEAIPFKKAGDLQMGDILPTQVSGIPVTASGLAGESAWKESGPYRFRVNATNKIDFIQYTFEPKSPACLDIQNKKIPRTIAYTRLRKLFPKCLGEPGIPSATITCDGFKFLWNPSARGETFLRVDISQNTIRDLMTERGQRVVDQEKRKFRGK